ncbi:hypothetical protein CHS0354_027977 [Potamilus streckersoni]|uniref:UvrD-like helicase C-terminal domain-containing protein n=1 Tax=Potamilus streckersoni TaxID=2493646 RepID=A0AAE0W661_9BIVA|nr:hypothetical protein CHS0354_027977 [Potamilus streckersoni]
MEQELLNPITGYFVEENADERGDDSDDDAADSDDMLWLSYKEMNSADSSFAAFQRTKSLKGFLKSIQTGSKKPVPVVGSFHLPDQWWEIKVLRTSKFRDVYCPKDKFALSYRLRDDAKTSEHHLVDLFFTKIEKTTQKSEYPRSSNTVMSNGREQFSRYLGEIQMEGKMNFDNLGQTLQDFYFSLSDEDQKSVGQFVKHVWESDEMHFVTTAQHHPDVLKYGAQLFPCHFMSLLKLSDVRLGRLVSAIHEEPVTLGFKALMKIKCGILGCETSLKALDLSGLGAKLSRRDRNSLKIYEKLKEVTREDGHTRVLYTDLVRMLDDTVNNWTDCMDFLQMHNIVKKIREGGSTVVYLYNLWHAERKIAKGINKLILANTEKPWKLDVDWERDMFTTIKEDPDQWRAAQLIMDQPVVAISGKGGCGKTHVVTSTIKAAKENGDDDVNSSGCWGDKSDNCNFSDEEHFVGIDEVESKCGAPQSLTEYVLLTAPTGKAANLLGRRAGKQAYTLHQIIFTYRMKKDEWPHNNVKILVVDECSLVPVTTFSVLLDILLNNSQLQKIILLGDIRQLPSIEPGNFLADVFDVLLTIGSAIELKTNHRAESELIIDNATKISNRQKPTFDRERKFVWCNVPEAANGNYEYVSQDILEVVKSLLETEYLKNHVTSQFVCFTRNMVEAINDICCNKYSKHRIKNEKKKLVFQKGDKICFSKNGWIQLFIEQGEDFLPAMEENKTKTDSDKKKSKTLRLSNGEIYFITQDREINGVRYLQLSEDNDIKNSSNFWVSFQELRRECRLMHAWARTIHTYQGSETDNVVYIVTPSKRQNWQHVYTAITRGKKAVFIVGQESKLYSAIKRKEIQRKTSLKRQLKNLFQIDATIVWPSTQTGLIPAHQTYAVDPTGSQYSPKNSKVDQTGFISSQEASYSKGSNVFGSIPKRTLMTAISERKENCSATKNTKGNDEIIALKNPNVVAEYEGEQKSVKLLTTGHENAAFQSGSTIHGSTWAQSTSPFFADHSSILQTDSNLKPFTSYMNQQNQSHSIFTKLKQRPSLSPQFNLQMDQPASPVEGTLAGNYRTENDSQFSDIDESLYFTIDTEMEEKLSNTTSHTQGNADQLDRDEQNLHESKGSPYKRQLSENIAEYLLTPKMRCKRKDETVSLTPVKDLLSLLAFSDSDDD